MSKLWSDEREPHQRRRKAILAAHPEVKQLFGPDWRTKYIVILLVSLQTYLACTVPCASLATRVILTYGVGATITQALFLAVHEMTHNLAFRSGFANRLGSTFANLPAVFPYAISFREYHLEHHVHQGEEQEDLDLPSALEVRLFRGTVGKALWLSLQIVAYALRPCLEKPKAIHKWHVWNAALQILYVSALWSCVGWSSISYCLWSVILSGGLHPCAGHFISEHYVCLSSTLQTTSQETFSYYGGLNRLTWNVGYHNEHHDLPQVAWSKLPHVTRMAPEFYRDLTVCDSWSKTLVRFVVSEDMGLSKRVKRKPQSLGGQLGG